MKRAPWLYTLMQIALWSIHGVLISYAQRYLAGMGMRDRKSTRLNSSHASKSRMPSSA